MSSSMVTLANSTATPLSAFESGSLGFSFGPAGYLILWYAGVVTVLEQLGIYQPGRALPAAGASSGAITSAAICSGTTSEQFYKSVLSLADECYRNPGSCSGSMDTIVRKQLSAFLPADAARRCNGTGFFSVTLLDAGDGGGFRFNAPQGGTVSRFQDQSDLIETLAASTYIPIWSGGSLFRQWRGQRAADGGIGMRQPCPPNVTYCVRIASTPPDMLPDGSNTQSSGMGPGAIAQALRNIQLAMGGSSAMQGAANSTREHPLPSTQPPANPQKVREFRDAGIDIAPGLAVNNPFDRETWSELSILPCDPDTCNYLYRMGQLDAMAWAEMTGVAAAAARRQRQQKAAMAAVKTPPAAAPAAKAAPAAAAATKAPPAAAPAKGALAAALMKPPK